MFRQLATCAAIVIASATWTASFAAGQEEPRFRERPFDGIQAGQEAFERAEAIRQQRIGEQAGLEDSIEDWRNGVDAVAYYRPPYYGGYAYGAGALRPDVTVGSSWGGGVGGYGGYGYAGAYGAYQNHYYVTPLDPGDGGYYQRSPTSGLYRPGYAIVVPSYQAYRQPIGQWNGQTGPNRWESHPVYGDEGFAEEAPVEDPLPPVSKEPIVKPKIIVPPPRREY